MRKTHKKKYIKKKKKQKQQPKNKKKKKKKKKALPHSSVHVDVTDSVMPNAVGGLRANVEL